MYVISARNVNGVYQKGLDLLMQEGRFEDTRVGPALVLPMPVTAVYSRPWERVLFNEERDANPFFHFFEALWMLQGRSDLKFVEYLLPRMRNYSDDGWLIRGSYGGRWRHWFEKDQINQVVQNLLEYSGSRRAVISMWDPQRDVNNSHKDTPCNTTMHFQVHGERVEMTTFCRSNDIIWGAYGANAVHLSMLQEYIAMKLGIVSGTWYQISNNFHAYMGVLEKIVGTEEEIEKQFMSLVDGEEYQCHDVTNVPISHGIYSGEWSVFDADLKAFFQRFDTEGPNLFLGPEQTFQTFFFRRVVVPMWHAFVTYRKEGAANAHTLIDAMMYHESEDINVDWHHAAERWLARRIQNATRTATETQN